jgi:hypothetical protein
MPVSKKKGEKKNDFINRCIGIEVSSGKKTSQATAVCYNIWEELSLKELKKKRKEQKLEDTKMIAAFKSISGEDFTKFGITKEDLENPKNQAGIVGDDEFNLHFAEIPEGYVVRYRYQAAEAGHRAQRPFCRMMTEDNESTWYSRQDIESLNSAPGKANRAGNKPYSVFNWRGGNNCKHIWVRFWFNEETGDFLKTPVQPLQKSTTPQ